MKGFGEERFLLPSVEEKLDHIGERSSRERGEEKKARSGGGEGRFSL